MTVGVQPSGSQLEIWSRLVAGSYLTWTFPSQLPRSLEDALSVRVSIDHV